MCPTLLPNIPLRSLKDAKSAYANGDCANKPNNATCLELKTKLSGTKSALKLEEARMESGARTGDPAGSSSSGTGAPEASTSAVASQDAPDDSSADPDGGGGGGGGGGVGAGGIFAIIFFLVILPIGLIVGYLYWARRSAEDSANATTFNPTNGPPHATTTRAASSRSVQRTANNLYDGSVGLVDAPARATPSTRSGAAGTKKKKKKNSASARKGAASNRPATSALANSFRGLPAPSGWSIFGSTPCRVRVARLI